ncbi:hypothetical protein Ndes2437B_g01546 [Nannochloris sp. 'desiccata']
MIRAVVKDFFMNRITMATFDWPVMAKATPNAPKHFHAVKCLGSVVGFVLFLACTNCVAHAGVQKVAAGPLSGVTTSDIVNTILGLVSVIINRGLVWFGRALFGRMNKMDTKIDDNSNNTNTKIDSLGQKVDGFIGSVHQVEVTGSYRSEGAK